MKYDLKENNNKGVVVLMVGETQNTFGYKDNKELFEIVENMLKSGQRCMDIYDYDSRFIYFVYNNEDLEDLKKELGVN